MNPREQARRREAVETPVQIIAVGLVAHGQRAGRATYVVTRRRAHTHLGGMWELPGGKVVPGEPPPAALQRELTEELGVITADPTPLTFSYHVYEDPLVDRPLLLLFYRTHTLAGSPPPRPLAADALRLLTASELVHLPMPAANAPLIALLSAPDWSL